MLGIQVLFIEVKVQIKNFYIEDLQDNALEDDISIVQETIHVNKSLVFINYEVTNLLEKNYVFKVHY